MWARRTSAVLAIIYGAYFVVGLVISAYYEAKFGKGFLGWGDAISLLEASALILGAAAALRGRVRYLTAAWVFALAMSVRHLTTLKKPTLPTSLLHRTPATVTMFMRGNEFAWHFMLGMAIIMMTVSLVGLGLAIYGEVHQRPALST
jgi:hypothetical protein